MVEYGSARVCVRVGCSSNFEGRGGKQGRVGDVAMPSWFAVPMTMDAVWASWRLFGVEPGNNEWNGNCGNGGGLLYARSITKRGSNLGPSSLTLRIRSLFGAKERSEFKKGFEMGSPSLYFLPSPPWPPLLCRPHRLCIFNGLDFFGPRPLPTYAGHNSRGGVFGK